MKVAVILIVAGLILILALPPYLDGRIRKKGNRKAAVKLSQIFGYLFVIGGVWNAIEYLLTAND
ncbi:MAG: hypothetical protein NC311_20350 [Muribaculaceae bacterium]|nr:hypothetical protein [Muribaculaceae bacterium]